MAGPPRWWALPWPLLSLIANVLAQGAGTNSDIHISSPQDYAPNVNQTCPDVTTAPLVRVFTPSNQTLHPEEQRYVSERLSTVVEDAWHEWLGDGSGIGYEMSAFNMTESAKIGIAISGGGYRAAQYGAGVLSALDARNESAKAAGTGGLLQVASYIAGLSGGSWITGSLFFNDFPTVEHMVFGNDQLSGWLLDIDLATPDGLDLFSDKNQYFFGGLLWSVIAKANQWIDTSMTDPWARMISYHFLNQTSRDNFFTNDTGHGAGQLWSDIPHIPSFQTRQLPFPIIMANSRPVGSNLTTRLAPGPIVYEVSPYEFGSWDPNLGAMLNLTYAGTHLTNGVPVNSTSCVTAFDQAGFVMGTSASLFNQILDFANNELSSFGADGSGLLYTLQRQLAAVRTRADDVANWPNPFHGIKPDTFEDSNATWLELIDGSSNAENVPLGSLFVKARGLDTIVALDGSADDLNSWPNGSSILFTQSRLATLLQESHQQFPPIPADPEHFISTGVRQRPTFFGCDPSQNPPEFPLVIYMPNSPPFNGEDPVTNTGTFKIQYQPLHSRLFIDQAHANTISGFLAKSNAPDPSWGKCLQCAAIDRARYRVRPTVLPRSDFCAKCFARYCYNPMYAPDGGMVINRKLGFVDPQPTGFSKLGLFFSRNKFAFVGALIALVVIVCALIAFLFYRRKKVTKAREAQYARLKESEEWKADNRPFDPYAEVDEPSSESAGYYAHAKFRESQYSYSGTTAVASTPTPRSAKFDLSGYRDSPGHSPMASSFGGGRRPGGDVSEDGRSRVSVASEWTGRVPASR